MPHPVIGAGKLGEHPWLCPGGSAPRKVARAHLAVNLRYPTMGETSLTQMQIWEHALPSRVTQTGWYESCPPDVAAFVRPDCEIADLRSHLTTLVRFPERFAAMGEGGLRLLLEQHSPVRYVVFLLRFGAEARQSGRRPLRPGLTERVGTETKRRMVDGACDILANRVSSEISSLWAEPDADRAGSRSDVSAGAWCGCDARRGPHQ